MVQVIPDPLARLDQPLSFKSFNPAVRRLIQKIFPHPDRLDVLAFTPERLILERLPEFNDHLA